MPHSVTIVTAILCLGCTVLGGCSRAPSQPTRPAAVIDDQGSVITASATATSTDRSEARQLARARASGDLAAYVGTTIASEVEQVLADGTDRWGTWGESRSRSELSASTNTRLEGLQVIDETITVNPSGHFTCAVSLQVDAEELFPARSLIAATAAEDAGKRLSDLLDLGDRFDAGGKTAWAELAYRRAATDPATGTRELIALASFLERQGERSQALAVLDGIGPENEPSSELGQQASNLRRRLSERARPVDQSITALEALAERHRLRERLLISQTTHGTINETWIRVGGTPCPLLAIWIDHESIARFPIAEDQAVHGSYQLTLELEAGQSGSVILFTLPADDPAWRSAHGLDLPITRSAASAADQLRVTDLVEALGIAARRGQVAGAHLQLGAGQR